MSREIRLERVASDCRVAIGSMQGDWVVPKNAYEKRFCELLGWRCVNHRYYDAAVGETLCVEIKKGQSQMWFDMVRYAEIFSGVGTQNTVTVFFKWNKRAKRVDRVLVMDTERLMQRLGINACVAQCILLANELLPGRVNHQQGLSHLQMESIAAHVVEHPESKRRRKKRGGGTA